MCTEVLDNLEEIQREQSTQQGFSDISTQSEFPRFSAYQAHQGKGKMQRKLAFDEQDNGEVKSYQSCSSPLKKLLRILQAVCTVYVVAKLVKSRILGQVLRLIWRFLKARFLLPLRAFGKLKA